MSSPSLITFLAHAPSSRTSGSRSIAGRCRRGRARGSSQVGNAEVRRNDVAGPCGRSACEPRLAETFNPAAAADVPHGPGAASLERGASQGAAAARLFPGRWGCPLRQLPRGRHQEPLRWQRRELGSPAVVTASNSRGVHPSRRRECNRLPSGRDAGVRRDNTGRALRG